MLLRVRSHFCLADYFQTGEMSIFLNVYLKSLVFAASFLYTALQYTLSFEP